jgi:hypothetical protein
MAHLHPSKGGCWYCQQDGENESLLFSWEFDCGVHETCLREHHSSDPDDLESEIMFDELLKEK